MTIQYLTKPEWKIDTPGFENIIYGESSTGIHRYEAEIYCRECGPGFRLPSADETIAFRSASITHLLTRIEEKEDVFQPTKAWFNERMRREEQYAIAPQLTGTVFAYLNLKGVPYLAFTDTRGPSAAPGILPNGELAVRFNEFDTKRTKNELLVLSINDVDVRALICRAELADRIVPVPEALFTFDPLNGAKHLSLSTVLEKNGTSQYGQSPIVKAILPKTSEMNATMIQCVEQWFKKSGAQYTKNEGIIHSGLPYIGRGCATSLERLPENKVAIGAVTLRGAEGWKYNSQINTTYLEFTYSYSVNNRLRPVKDCERFLP